MFDALDPRDLVPAEAEQLLTAGYPAAEHLARARAAGETGDLTELAAIERELSILQRSPDWAYDEPDIPEFSAAPGDVDSTARTSAAAARPADGSGEVAPDLGERIRGAWLGRCVGNTMGKPVEGMSQAAIETYLRAAGAWPLTGFVPYLDPLPAGVKALHPSALNACAGRFDAVPRDDDLDWTMLGLHVLETYGRDFTTADLAREWLDRMPFTQTYTAERVAYRNLVAGLVPPETATVRNPYREWIGALIRVDSYGYINPGNPAEAARLAWIDARLSHTANGVYGAQWAAALVAQALVSDRIEDCLAAALDVIPPRSRLAESQRTLLDLARRGAPVAEAFGWIDRHLDYGWVHTLNNAAIIAAALLWGGSDFLRTLDLTITAGRDTDSNAATVGSVFGALHGPSAVPADLVAAGNQTVRSAVRGFDNTRIPDLVRRTAALLL